MSDLLKLAEQCEAATGPDRELDGEICLALGWTFQKMKGDQRAYFRKPGVTEYYMRSEPPTYTASLDAAMTLVPEGWVLSSFGISDDRSHWFAMCWPHDAWQDIRPNVPDGSASTPALVLCAAALRARGRAPSGQALVSDGAAQGVSTLTGFDLADWNDAPVRTQAEVIEAFRKAAELARASMSHGEKQ